MNPNEERWDGWFATDFEGPAADVVSGEDDDEEED